MRPFFDGAAFPALWVFALAASLGVGWLVGRRRPERVPGVFEGTVVVLTGALLAALWTAAYQSHSWRLSLVHDEADYLGRCYRYSTLLPKEDRKWLRAHLLAYVDAKLRYLAEGGQAVLRTQPELVRLHLQIWDHLSALQLPNDYPRQACLAAFNEIVEVHFRRLYAYGERAPAAALGLAACGCLASAFLAGWCSRSRGAALVTVLMLGAAFLAIRDLDDTLGGGLQDDYVNLKNLRIYMFQDPE